MLLAVGVHAAGVFGTFHYDDHHVLVANANLDDPRSISAFFVNPGLSSADPKAGMYRPVLMVSFALNRWISGREAWGFLAGNLLIHLAVCALAYFLARDLGRGAGGPPRRAARIATVVGCLCAVHPVLVETVSYVSARSSSLATFWVLGAVWCGLLAVRGERYRWDLGIAALLLTACGCLTKEIAVTSPFLFAACALLCRPAPERGGGRRVLLGALGMLVVVLGYLWVRALVLGAALPDLGGKAGGEDAFRGSHRSAWVNLLTQVVVVVRYLGLELWPHSLSIDHGARIIASPLDPVFLAAFALLAGLSFWALRHPRRHPLRAAGWIWFGLALAPTSSILPLNVLMNEHRLYLPTFGLYLILGAGWVRLRVLLRARPSWLRGARLRMASLAALGLLAVLGARATHRKLDWLSEERIWSGALEVNPDSVIVCMGYANVLVQRGDLAGAVGLLERAVALDPRHNAGRINLSECLLRRYEGGGSELDLERALAMLEQMHRERPRSTLVALKAARARQLRFLLHREPEDARAADERLHSVLRVVPRHAGALECLARFRREREEIAALPQDSRSGDTR